MSKKTHPSINPENFAGFTTRGQTYTWHGHRISQSDGAHEFRAPTSRKTPMSPSSSQNLAEADANSVRLRRQEHEMQTRDAFEKRMKSTNEDDFFTLEGPLTVAEIGNRLEEMMRLVAEEDARRNSSDK